MITIKLEGKKKVVAQLEAMPVAVQVALLQKMEALAVMLQSYIRTDKLSGQVLKVRSGALRRSIQKTVTNFGKRIIAQIFSSGDVKYAGIHEFGGTINHPGGTPYIPRKGMLAIFVSKSDMFAQALPKTKPHPIPMPERSFMRTGLHDKTKEISEGMKEAVLRGLLTAQGKS